MTPAHPTRAFGVAAAVLVALLATLTGCGGGTDGSDSSGSSRPAQSAPSTASAAQRDAREAAGGDSPPGGAEVVAPADDPAATIDVTLAGGFSTGDTAVSVGDVVELTAGDDRDHSLVVGDLPAAPLAGGASYVRFTQAGTYLVTDVPTGSTTTITAD